MVEVTYHCPYCGAVTAVDREGYLDDKCVSREPLAGWEYAATTEDFESADGIEFVCLGNGTGDSDADAATGSDDDDAATGSDDDDVDPVTGRDSDAAGGANDPNPDKDGCGRTFYLSFVRYDEGEERDHRLPDIDRPRFDFDP